MLRRHCLLLATLAPAIAVPSSACAQSGSVDAEAELRQAVSAYFAAWNRHDTEAWARFFTEDIEWVFIDSNLKKGRETIATYGAYLVRGLDVKFEIAKLRLYEDGSRATVVLRGQYLELPVRDGKYTRIYDRYPLLSRWRREGGAWRLFYLNDYAPEAAGIAKTEGLD